MNANARTTKRHKKKVLAINMINFQRIREHGSTEQKDKLAEIEYREVFIRDYLRRRKLKDEMTCCEHQEQLGKEGNSYPLRDQYHLRLKEQFNQYIRDKCQERKGGLQQRKQFKESGSRVMVNAPGGVFITNEDGYLEGALAELTASFASCPDEKELQSQLENEMQLISLEMEFLKEDAEKSKQLTDGQQESQCCDGLRETDSTKCIETGLDLTSLKLELLSEREIEKSKVKGVVQQEYKI